MINSAEDAVLIPLLLDDPLWGVNFNLAYDFTEVLIPLLLDDPLWVGFYVQDAKFNCLNPSFAG